jgi:hypothetical protein
MKKAMMCVEIKGPLSFPGGLLSEAINNHLFDLGLTCLDRGGSDNIVPAKLSSAPSATDDVIVLGRIVWINELLAPAGGAAE